MALESLKLEKFRTNEISSKQLKHIQGGNTATPGETVVSVGTGNTHCWDSDTKDAQGRVTYYGYVITIKDSDFSYSPTGPQFK
jgi:natural product precursor